jgi:DNA-binding MarR family transcriptional regulator
MAINGSPEAHAAACPIGCRELVYPASNEAPLRQRNLAAQMSINPTTLVGDLDRLEAQGLIRRDADPADRSAKRVSLAREAMPVLRTILAQTGDVREQATAGLSSTEVARLRSALTRMPGNMMPEPG